MDQQKVYAIVLAAGKGTRMKSALAKVLHQVFFAPMICHVLDTLNELEVDETVVVTGHQGTEVEKALASYGVAFARQEQQLGTGHAVLATESMLSSREGIALILCGDTPLIRAFTLRAMLNQHIRDGAKLTVMSTEMADPANYGRIVVNDDLHIDKIVEEKDASAEELLIREVNAGIYCVNIDFLFEAVSEVGTDNKQGEVYLTDIVEIANQKEHPARRFMCPESSETIGVNSRIELSTAHKIMQARRNEELMLSGVTMLDPGSVLVEKSVRIGQDTVINANCHLAGDTDIGQGCIVEPFVKLENCQVAPGTVVKSFTDSHGQKF